MKFRLRFWHSQKSHYFVNQDINSQNNSNIEILVIYTGRQESLIGNYWNLTRLQYYSLVYLFNFLKGIENTD